MPATGSACRSVVERCRNSGDPIESRFFPEKSFFAATAILRFAACHVPPLSPSINPGAILEFHNPLISRKASADDDASPLALDLSAPLAKTLEAAPRTYFAGFIEPGAPTTMARLN